MVKQACDALLLVLLPYLSAPPCTSAIGAAGWASLFRDSIDSLDLTLDSTHSTDMQSKDVNEAIQTQQPSKPARNSPRRRATPSILLYSTHHHRKQKCSGIITAAGTPGSDAPRSPAR